METEATKQNAVQSPEEVLAFLNNEPSKTDHTEKNKRCPDSEGLGFWSDGKFTVGFVNEVNGPDSAEVPLFTATRHELIQLVKFWTAEVLHQRLFYFFHGQTGSSEFRRGAFASRRIARMAEILGHEVVNGAVDQVYEEVGKKQHARAWHIFLHGTPQEQEAFRCEVYEEEEFASAKDRLFECEEV
jgi:hypothetical protein